MNFHSRFNLKRSKRRTESIPALQSLHLSRLTELPHGLRALLVEDIANVLAHLICKLFIFLDLFLSVPEPFVNLLLLKVEV